MMKVFTPLLSAVPNSHEETVLILIEIGADVNARDQHTLSPLFYVSQNNLSKVLQKIINEHDGNTNDHDAMNNTLLMMATEAGNQENIEFLINKGAEIHALTEGNQWDALEVACYHGHLEITFFLLENGAKINGHEDDGPVPLVLASQEGKTDAAKILLDRGANVNAFSIDGDCLIIAACKKGRVDVVQLLIDRGADLTVLDRVAHWNLLSIACNNGHFEVHR
jgi:ankyrin repeat protein